MNISDQLGELFKHTDGGFYQLYYVSASTVDQSLWVVYEHVWPFESKVWHRPLDEWKSRFTQVQESELLFCQDAYERETYQKIVRERKAARKKNGEALKLTWTDEGVREGTRTHNWSASTAFGTIRVCFDGNRAMCVAHPVTSPIIGLSVPTVEEVLHKAEVAYFNNFATGRPHEG